MRRLTIAVVALLLTLSISAQGIEFFKGSWQEALTLAAKEERLIFVDAYAEWCGPCKRMSATVFPDERAGAFYNRNFINLKIDMEKPENKEFASKYPVGAYPTLFFINAEGKVVQQVKGAQQVEQLIKLGQDALAKAEPTEEYAQAYEGGDRSPEMVYKYVRALIRNGENHLKVANDYLREQQDLSQPENLRFLLLAATEADSRIFSLLTEHRDAVVAQEGEEAFKGQVWHACRATAEKAIKFQSRELLEEAGNLMRTFYPEQANRFVLESELNYCERTNDAKGFVKANRDYAKLIVSDPDLLDQQAKRLATTFPTDSRAMAQAEEMAKAAAGQSDDYQHHYTLASILNQQGKKMEALSAANKALELAKANDPTGARLVQVLIRAIENS